MPSPEKNDSSTTAAMSNKTQSKDKEQSSKRIRKEPERYGSRECDLGNDDDFHEADRLAGIADALSDVRDTVSATSNAVDLSVFSPGEKIIYKKLCDIGAQLKVLNNRVTDIEVTLETKKQVKLQKPDKQLLIKLGLPLKSIEALNNFEFELLKIEFETEVFGALHIIGGTNGKSNGVRVLVALFECLFEKEFLRGITWTGRSATNAQKKIPLKEKKQTLSIITRLCTIADQAYSADQCEHDIKYTVLKYAYLGGNTNSKSKRGNATPAGAVNNGANTGSGQPNTGAGQSAADTKSQQQNHMIPPRYDAFNYVSFPPPQQANQHSNQKANQPANQHLIQHIPIQNVQYHSIQNQYQNQVMTDPNGNPILYK